jgi:hypothetical protein
MELPPQWEKPRWFRLVLGYALAVIGANVTRAPSLFSTDATLYRWFVGSGEA